MSKEKFFLQKTSSLSDLASDVWAHNKSVHLASKGAARPWVCRDAEFPLLALLPDQRQVRDFAADAETISLFNSIEILPELSFSDDEKKTAALCLRRGDILEHFKGGGSVLAATPASLLAPFSLGGDYFNFKIGDDIGRERFLDWLAISGYERSDIVWSPGQYVSRGSVVDVFSPSDPFPTRVEFFDDEVESIRFYLSETQKSLRALRQCSMQSLCSRSETDLMEFFPPEMRVVFFDPKELDMTAENSAWLWKSLEIEKQNAIPWRAWKNLLISLSASVKRIRVVHDVSNSSIRLPVRQIPPFKGKLKDVEAYCSDLRREGYAIRVYSEAERSLEWAERFGAEAQRGMLSEGFIDTASKMVLLSDLELAGITLTGRGYERRAPGDWGAGLIPGQLVVHDDYGVAEYIGTKRVDTQEGEQEYLVLRFAEDRRLLIPVLHFYKISPWSSITGQEPVLDSLKGSRWRKSAEKARKSAKEASQALIKIYAERELAVGHSFASNKEMMKMVEDGFIYIETADQLRAFEAVEKDMESVVPMDRLVIGDVGFGKTEVAVRAAAKAVFDGKQVAVMTPTTLLAQQHYETFSSRFGAFPIRVEVLSRFVPPSLQKKIVEDAKAGKVDIIIGTHRILSRDVGFKDLGLLIIDEEHRFGVMHKEQLKKAMPGVDVLSLSATPIPRSLSLSISGLKDMSVLQTPPQRRLPVITVVRPWSEKLLVSAVLREKNRGGQVFFVHNRIKNIQERTQMLKRLFPKLSVATAHSKTPEHELEKIMMDFAAGNIDILVCTTIVESGLDIPGANTLIVDDSHELGLAQMYQLRGRVGRREEQAYAFLFYPTDVNLSVEASERLEAIADLDELGAGYRLAQRDLQIRGGGDLIGLAQHGNSCRVGYQKYCDMLAEEINNLRGKSRGRVDLEVGFPATIPGDYLPQNSLRVTLYRRLLKLESLAEADELMEETEDRFGKIPPSLLFLFDLAAIRAEAPSLSVTKIICSRYETVIQGSLEGEWKNLKLPPLWMRRLDGYVGPGGFKGMKELASAVRGNLDANLLQ